MSKNESKTLNESLKVNPDILSQLKDLEGLGIDPNLFLQFEARIKKIIGENPGSESIIEGELEKTSLSFENLFSNYNEKRLPGIIYAAAHDDFGTLVA